MQQAGMVWFKNLEAKMSRIPVCLLKVFGGKCHSLMAHRRHAFAAARRRASSWR
jgi:hypothetical protein